MDSFQLMAAENNYQWRRENENKKAQRRADVEEFVKWLQPISHEVRMIQGSHDVIETYHKILDKLAELRKEIEVK